MIRDLLIFGIFAWAGFHAFSKAHYGVYLWTWISLMNPHQLSWGYATSFPFAMAIAAITLTALLTSKEPKQSIWAPETVLILLHLAWVALTTFNAINPEGAKYEFDRFWKIQLFTLLSILLITDRKKLDTFIWVLVGCIGFYGVKGGIFTILTGGHARVWGPEGSFIGGNNEVALAMLMTVPLMRYLQLQTTNKWVSRGLLASMLLTAMAIIGSLSRGAFLGTFAIGAFFWLKSKNKGASLIVVAIVIATILSFMPQTFWDRMNTIQTYQEDTSAMGRVNAWYVAVAVANNYPLGGGANVFTKEMFRLYAPVPEDVHDVHSIYFEQIGEQGWVGFSIWLTLYTVAWFQCGRLMRMGRKRPETKWASDLGAMLQVALIGYAVTGAFLGLSYWDYPYDLIALGVIARKIIEAEQTKQDRQTERDNKQIKVRARQATLPAPG
jgi:probable O-glycosylation ligase (exosortase A-associated)